MDFGLDKNEKLKSEKDISRLFSNGNWEFIYPFKFVVLSSDSPNNRILISVPKKYHKHAVDRNRIKRLVRESYRTNKHTLTQQSLDIGFVYISKTIENFQTVQRTIKNALKRIENTSKK